MMKRTSLLLSLFLVLVFTSSFCFAEDDETESVIKHPAKNVIERRLVLEKANTKIILKENKNYAAATEKKNFQGDTLAYVTPWNNHGYDVAKIFNNKFTYVSPVWFQVKFQKAVEYAFAKVNEIKEAILDVCVKHKFDGVVLEGLAGVVSAGEEAQDFVNTIANGLHAERKIVILVISPDARSFGASQFAAYSKFIDKFSLMTYDHSSFERPGPVAPIGWMEKAVQDLQVNSELSSKIMLGLNFYGFDFVTAEKTGAAIVGESYLQLLKKHNPKIYWDSTTAEHSFTHKDQGKTHTVYYPTLKSVHERIKLAERLGLSLSIWEIGQGLDYFYDLL